METLLSFSISHHFNSSGAGITIPCRLMSNDKAVSIVAKVDTGSEFCLFGREVAESLGIEVENGYALRISTLGGLLTAYAHTVILETFGLRFESYVLFHPAYETNRNLLGRVGWLNNLHMALTMDDEVIYLKHIGEEAL